MNDNSDDNPNLGIYQYIRNMELSPLIRSLTTLAIASSQTPNLFPIPYSHPNVRLHTPSRALLTALMFESRILG